MKIKSNTKYVILFFLMFALHFFIWQNLKIGFETTFIKYYLFLTLLFMMVVTVISIIKKIYPNYVGFGFMGLVMFKLMLMLLVMKKLNLNEVPNYKVHFIIPYLIALVLETLYAVKIIQDGEVSETSKDEKNQ